MNNQKKCSTDPKLLRDFLNLCDGSWHNSIYLSCSTCRYGSPEPCGDRDFLFLPDKTGFPILLPISDARLIFPVCPEKEECLIHLGLPRFTRMYEALILSLEGKEECPCLLLCKKAGNNYNW